MHWYAYHSEKTMGYPYSSVGASGMYLKREPKNLLLGDIIWVIAGGVSTPTHFTLVDCFQHDRAERAPFSGRYSKFEIRVLGSRSLLRSPVRLSRNDEWFADLHARFITKQRFFVSLESEPDKVEGLSRVSGITF